MSQTFDPEKLVSIMGHNTVSIQTLDARTYPKLGDRAPQLLSHMSWLLSGSIAQLRNVAIADEKSAVKELCVQEFLPGRGIIGLQEITAQQPMGREDQFYVSVKDTKVASISAETFRIAYTKSGYLRNLCTTELARQNQLLLDRLCDNSYQSVKTRVWRYVLRCAYMPTAVTHPDGKQFTSTREYIARYVGCSREMAGRILLELQAEGLLRAQGKTFVVFLEKETYTNTAKAASA